MSWELESEWGGRRFPRQSHVETGPGKVYAGKRDVWAEPVAAEDGEPGVSEHSKSWDFI